MNTSAEHLTRQKQLLAPSGTKKWSPGEVCTGGRNTGGCFLWEGGGGRGDEFWVRYVELELVGYWGWPLLGKRTQTGGQGGDEHRGGS